jgi:hypothetical protein
MFVVFQRIETRMVHKLSWIDVLACGTPGVGELSAYLARCKGKSIPVMCQKSIGGIVHDFNALRMRRRTVVGCPSR